MKNGKKNYAKLHYSVQSALWYMIKRVNKILTC